MNLEGERGRNGVEFFLRYLDTELQFNFDEARNEY